MHPGSSYIKAPACGCVWWPHLDETLKQIVSSCGVCQALHATTPEVTLVLWSWPTHCWQHNHTHLTEKAGHAVMNRHSKWPEVQIMLQITGEAVCEILRSLLTCWGIAKEVISDYGPPYQSKAFTTFLHNSVVTHIPMPVYRRASKGIDEHMICNLKTVFIKQV